MRRCRGGDWNRIGSRGRRCRFLLWSSKVTKGSVFSGALWLNENILTVQFGPRRVLTLQAF